MRHINRSLLLSISALLVCAGGAAAQPLATINDLGTLGGSSSTGFKVNGSGGVIGFSRTAGDAEDLAFFYDYYRDAVFDPTNSDPNGQPKNEEYAINFTGPGSITRSQR